MQKDSVMCQTAMLAVKGVSKAAGMLVWKTAAAYILGGRIDLLLQVVRLSIMSGRVCNSNQQSPSLYTTLLPPPSKVLTESYCKTPSAPKTGTKQAET